MLNSGDFMHRKTKGDIWKYAVIGALAGTANGFFGAGGGLFLVPLFIGWIKMEEKKAFATSVAVILPLSVASLVVFILRGENIVSTALPYVLGGILGGLISGNLFRRISVIWLHRLFGFLLLYGAFRTLLA